MDFSCQSDIDCIKKVRKTLWPILLVAIGTHVAMAQHSKVTIAGTLGDFISIPKAANKESSEIELQLGIDLSMRIRQKAWTPFTTNIFAMPSLMYAKKESSIPDRDYFYAYHLFMPFGLRQMWSTKIMNGYETGFTLFADAGLRLRYTINAFLVAKAYPISQPGTIVLDPGQLNAVYEFRGNPIINEDRFGLNGAFGLGARYRRLELYFGLYFPMGREISNEPVLIRDSGLQSEYFSWVRKNIFNDKMLCVGYYF